MTDFSGMSDADLMNAYATAKAAAPPAPPDPRMMSDAELINAHNAETMRQNSISGISQGPLQQIAHGMFPFGLDDKMRAAAAAAHESLSGGLPFSEAYRQALPQYQAATTQQQQAEPGSSAAFGAVGSIPPLLLGGEAINAGLRAAGPVGQFLAGEAATPFVTRSATTGQFQALTGAQKAINYGTKLASSAALMGREGAQAAAYGGGNGEDIARGAGLGILAGGLAKPVLSAADTAISAPLNAVKSMGHGAQGIAGVLGAGQLAEHWDKLAGLIHHPLALAGLGAAGATAATAKFLAAHPDAAELLTRMGVMAAARPALPGLLGANQ